MKTTIPLSLILITLLSTTFVLRAQDTPIISEFMTSNLEALEDEDEDASDWIEFYNPGDATYNLSGHFLTDDRRNLRKWKMPGNLNVDPGGYRLVFASGKDRGGIFASVYHTNFELSDDGEYLALVAADGETILSEYANRYPNQRTGLSFGIGSNEEGGSDWRYFESPTPEAANGEGRADLPPRVADTKFNFTRGFYDEPITVEITTATEGATIYYSINGSDPGPGSVFVPGTKYTEPITVNETTMLRARAYKDGLEPTNIDTHTYLFIDSVLQQPEEQPGLPDRWNGQPSNYGISQEVVESDEYRDRIRDAFLALPTLSIVTDEANLWSSKGLYLNTTRSAPAGSGADFEYEFEVSAELLNPDGSEGFQIQAGLRAQGGASRNADRSPKHAMSLRFRRDYGEGRLNYPILKSSPQQSYNAIHLRARYNNSWIHNDSGQRGRAQYIRDQWARDSMIEMGTPSGGHGDYHHIYLNGLYWGIFVVQERMDGSHYADYYGGRGDELDSINGGRATDGDLKSYNAMRDAARDKDWDEVLQRLDVDNYIDWHIIQRFASNRDWKNDGNWKAAGGGPDDRLWRYYAWDTERILEGVRDGRPGPSQDPSTIFNSLEDIPEFVQRFGDRLHKHLFNGGALTPQRNVARYQRRADELDLAIVAESARWGDHRRGAAYERDQEWVTERDRVLEDYFPERTDEAIDQFQDEGLYPRTLGVDLNQFGGRVPAGFELELSSEGISIFNPGKFYFTTDGSDPRGDDGNVNDTATEYEDPIPLTESLTFKARVRGAGNEWSALTETFFAVDTALPATDSLVVSEVMYHPGPPSAEESAAGHVSSDDFEYLELQNVGNQALDLAGTTFTSGIRFGFEPGPHAILAPGASALIVRDEAAFRFRYGDEPVIRGVFAFDSSLNNDGESIRLAAEDGSEILSFSYGDGGSWPQTADGDGFSLVLADPQGNSDPDRGNAWRASAETGGSPGSDDAPVDFAVVINEILTNSASPAVDTIELFNPGSTPVDVGHWFLTDDAGQPDKYAIPAETTIPPGGYLVIFEDNDSDPANNDSLPAEFFGAAFGLSSRGDSIHLFSANAEGQLTGYNDGFSFGAADEGVTFGRHVDSQGRIEYPPQSAASLGAANGTPAVGELVISEIMYHSTHVLGEIGDAGEYLEIANRSDQTIDLGGWSISGIDYAFPEGASIAAGQAILVSRVGAASFSQWYDVPDSIDVFGPYNGRLSNDGERITLQRPGETYLDGDTEKTAEIAVDSVRYNDAEPWPVMADGVGHSLERRDLNAYADEVTNWALSEKDQGSPGVVDLTVNPEPEPTGPTFAEWRSTVFTADQLADETISGPLANPDGDDLNNQLEYALGTSPLTGNGVPLAIERVGPDVSVDYERRRALPGFTLTLETSVDLRSWEAAGGLVTETGTAVIDDTRERVGLTLSIGAPMRYLRLALVETNP